MHSSFLPVIDWVTNEYHLRNWFNYFLDYFWCNPYVLPEYYRSVVPSVECVPACWLLNCQAAIRSPPSFWN